VVNNLVSPLCEFPNKLGILGADLDTKIAEALRQPGQGYRLLGLKCWCVDIPEDKRRMDSCEPLLQEKFGRRDSMNDSEVVFSIVMVLKRLDEELLSRRQEFFLTSHADCEDRVADMAKVGNPIQ
jgi:hypothetical protein